jgi:ribosomal protein L19E
MPHGYGTPKGGQRDKNCHFTVWVLSVGYSKWYSSKDVSGLSRTTTTKEHVRVLMRDGKCRRACVLNRSGKRVREIHAESKRSSRGPIGDVHGG